MCDWFRILGKGWLRGTSLGRLNSYAVCVCAMVVMVGYEDPFLDFLLMLFFHRPNSKDLCQEKLSQWYLNSRSLYDRRFGLRKFYLSYTLIREWFICAIVVFLIVLSLLRLPLWVGVVVGCRWVCRYWVLTLSRVVSIIYCNIYC